jgi:hypothetical protein
LEILNYIKIKGLVRENKQVSKRQEGFQVIDHQKLFVTEALHVVILGKVVAVVLYKLAKVIVTKTSGLSLVGVLARFSCDFHQLYFISFYLHDSPVFRSVFLKLLEVIGVFSDVQQQRVLLRISVKLGKNNLKKQSEFCYRKNLRI